MGKRSDDEITLLLTDKIARCIGWAEEHLDVPLLVLYLKTDFSRKRASYVRTGFLEYEMFFALGAIKTLKDTRQTDEFYEYHNRTNLIKETSSFVGDWLSHLTALVCHEMAHVFERMSHLEPNITSNINNRYKTWNKPRKQHHNYLWRHLYRDLKRNQEHTPANIIVHSQDRKLMILFKQEKRI